MARKYEFKTGKYGWAMERCEEKVLIAAFHEIGSRIPPDCPWKEDFLGHFYQHGNGTSFDLIAAINSERRRLMLPIIEFEETNIYEYGRLNDKLWKSELRRQMKTEYTGLDTSRRIKWRRDAEDETARLPPPHNTHEEWKAMRQHRYGGGKLNEREIAMRAEALAQAQQQATSPRLDDRGRVIRQLKLIQTLPDPETLIHQVVTKLTPDVALDIAEDFDDPAIRTALVRQSLAA